MKIILASNNPSKVIQIKEVFDHHQDFTILTQEEAGIRGEAIEDGSTLEENALKKAFFVLEQLSVGHNYWIMADDTGLFINALDGKPGVHSARWAGPSATTEEITAFTLEQLKDVTDRRAKFVTKVALLSPRKEMLCCEGVVEGILLTEPRVKPQPKMPYSPLFQPNGNHKVWAEMTTAEENAISHRGIAFRKIRDFLLQQL